MENIKLKVTVDRTELNNIIGDVNKLQGKEIKVEVETRGLKESENTVKDFSNQLEKTGMKTNYLASQMKNRLVNGAITTVVKSLRDALTEMKAVDTEMTSLQMSTGKTAGELRALRDSAYEAAATLGTTASEYLKTISEFSGAGYEEQAERLSELAVMTTRVGNVTQETANKYITVIDKAYEYNGNVRKLTASIDGANAVSNEYGTNMDKIAAGFAEVGPVSAQAQVGIDEVTAALGTITAVTQGTGEEAGEALKSVFLGIMGDTQTEISDGVKWTADELSGLTDIIKEYVPEAYSAAEATNSMLDPMKVIGELAESMQSGLLTEQELMSAFAEAGDKLDTEKLTALIENWDMYENMLGTYAVSTGSVAREYEAYLDSWEAKTSQLSARWAELVNSLVETGTVKAVLDSIIGLVEFLDSDLGHLIITVTALTAAFRALSVVTALSGITAAVSQLKFLGWAAVTAATSVEGLQLVMSSLTEFLAANPLIIGGAAFIAAAAGIEKLKDAAIVTLDEQKEKIKELNAEYDEQFGQGSEYEDLIARINSLTVAEKARLDVLIEKNKEKRKEIALENAVEYDKFVDEYGGKYGGNSSTYTETVQGPFGGKPTEVTRKGTDYNKLSNDLWQLTQNYKDGSISLEEYRTKLTEVYDTYSGIAEQVRSYKEAGYDVSQFEPLLSFMGEVEGKIADITQLVDEQGNVIGTHEYAVNLAKKSAIDLLNEQRNLGLQYTATTEQILNQCDANILLADTALKAAQAELAELQAGPAPISYADKMVALQDEIDYYQSIIDSYGTARDMIRNAQGTSTNINSTGTKNAANKKDEHLESLKDIISLRKSELDLIEAQSGSVNSQVSKIKEIQAALHDQAEYLRKTGGSLEDINKLSSEWYSWQDKINKLQKDLQSELDSYVSNAFSDARDKRDERLKKLDDLIDAEKKKTEENEKQLDLAEKEKAVMEAKKKLQNTMNERNVRYWNGDTGQWEWSYNKNEVESAKEELRKAEEELSSYRKEVARNAIIEQYEAEKKRISDDYDEIEKTWKKVTKSLQTPTREISAILDDIAQNGTPELKAQVENVKKVLGDLGNYIADAAGSKFDDSSSDSSSSGTSKNLPKVRKTNEDGTSSAKPGEFLVTAGGILYWAEDGRKINTGLLEMYIGKPTTREYSDVKKAYTAFKVDTVTQRDWLKDNGFYDSGGILHGLGGIKATREDEMVLPPEITKEMLKPSANTIFQERLAELGVMYGASPKLSSIANMATTSMIGQQYNSTYQCGDIVLTEEQAKGTTVYELAQLSRTLRIRNKPN